MLMLNQFAKMKRMSYAFPLSFYPLVRGAFVLKKRPKKHHIRPRKTTPSQPNFNAVLIKLIDVTYNLVNSGNIVGVIILYLCAEAMFITHKVSSEALEGYLTKLFSLQYFHVLPLGVLLMISLVTNVVQAKYYKGHIKMLTQTRKELIHGLQSGQLKHLKIETTSGINPLEIDDDC